MAGHSKPTPIEAFTANIDDADRLVALSVAFTNARARRMRSELREKIGLALNIPQRQRDELDCAESDDVFVVLKPGGKLRRDNFDQHAPLLRQAIVAACAATETYLADKVTLEIRALVAKGEAPRRMRETPMTYGQWLDVEEYQRRRRGITEKVLGPHIRSSASTAPSKVGELLSLVGVEQWSKRLDAARGCKPGSTVADLDRVTLRRNKIAHEGDRHGYSRASISVDTVTSDLAMLRSVVAAIETLFAK